jgi:hypothetical protein
MVDYGHKRVSDFLGDLVPPFMVEIIFNKLYTLFTYCLDLNWNVALPYIP